MISLVPSDAADRLFAFLFSDIEGSTVRWEQRAEAMRPALARHDALLRAAFERYGGHVFKTVGDAFCVAFPNAVSAVDAAIEAARALAAEDFSAVGQVRVRIAIHAGAAEQRDGDYFGPTLNRVARLMSVVHGGQIALSGLAAGLIQGKLPGDVSLHDLGLHRLKDLAEPEHVFQVLAPDLEAEFPPLPSLGALPNNLPLQPTSFIGQEAALAELAALLTSFRLVTLAGSGGVGKTRLALQIGAELLERYPDGVWFAELAPLAEAEQVAETVANLFSLPSSGNRGATDVVISFLKHKKLLLILDNCEHLVAAVAALADAIVRHCPQVTLLVSSRAPLQIAGEHVYRMPTMGLPETAAPITAAEALKYPAIELFVERARAALGRYVLSDADAPSVVAVCRRLDGIALAVELAAPRLKILKPSQLLEKLNDRFRLLTGGSRTAVPRQQTLRAMVDWSYNLLSEPECVLMRRLSVFAGGWTANSAAAVCADENIDDWQVFDLLQSLVDKSLIVADRVGEVPRFRFLETVREYVAQRRVEAGEMLPHRHLTEHLVGLFERADRERETTPNAIWIEEFGPELDNVRAAINWAFGPEGDSRLGVLLVAYSHGLWTDFYLPAEQRRLRDLAVTKMDSLTHPKIGAKLYSASSVRGATRREDGLKAVEFARASGDSLTLGQALLASARPFLTVTELGTARHILDEALEIALIPGRAKLLSRVLLLLGIAESLKGQEHGAHAYYEQSLAVALKTGDKQILYTAYGNVAESFYAAGAAKEAIEKVREAIASAREAGDRWVECLLRNNLAAYLMAVGETEQGTAEALQALKEALRVGEEIVALISVQHLAYAVSLAGDLRTAIQIQAFLDAACRAKGVSLEPTELAVREQVLALIEDITSSVEFGNMAESGASMTLEQAAELVTSRVDDCSIPMRSIFARQSENSELPNISPYQLESLHFQETIDS